MARDVIPYVLLPQRGWVRVLLQEQAHLLPEYALDHQVVVETKPHGLTVERLLVLRGINTHGAHLLHEAHVDAAVLQVEPQPAGFAVEQLGINRFLNQRLQLCAGGRHAPLPRGVCLQLPDLLRSDHNGGASEPRRPVPDPPRLTAREQLIAETFRRLRPPLRNWPRLPAAWERSMLRAARPTRVLQPRQPLRCARAGSRGFPSCRTP